MNKICSREDIEDALNRIDAQLECGYLDISDGCCDDVEMYIVRKAIQEYKKNHNLEEKDDRTEN